MHWDTEAQSQLVQGWGGISLDQEIIDKAIVSVLLNPMQEVNSFCVMFSDLDNLLGILMQAAS